MSRPESHPGQQARLEAEDPDSEEPQPAELCDQVSVVLEVHEEQDQRTGAVDAECGEVGVVGGEQQTLTLTAMANPPSSATTR